jgi:hypothetical protein
LQILPLLVSVITGIGALYKYFYKKYKKEKQRAAQAEQRAIQAEQGAAQAEQRAIQAEQRAAQAETSLQEIGEEVRSRIGYEVGELEIHMVITDHHGTCHTRWIWRNIRKVRPDVALSHIPGKVFFSSPESSFSKWPTLSFKDQRKYEIEFLRKEKNYCEFQVKVKELTNNTLSYEFTADANEAFYMSEEELAGQKHSYEWYGFSMSSAAIESLVIKIYFPQHYQADNIYPGVCIGLEPTEFSDRAEVDRIISSGGFKNEAGEVSITVKKPKFGYIYFLRWRPSPAAWLPR